MRQAVLERALHRSGPRGRDCGRPGPAPSASATTRTRRWITSSRLGDGHDKKAASASSMKSAKMRPRALAPLASVLDERRYVDSVLLGERIEARPAFRFIAATNTVDLEQTALPDFIKSRLRPVITVGYPEREEIERILRGRFDAVGTDGRHLLDRFWKFWNEIGTTTGSQRPATASTFLPLPPIWPTFRSLSGGGAYDLEKTACRHEPFGARISRAPLTHSMRVWGWLTDGNTGS